MKKMVIPYNVKNLMSQITLNYKSTEKKAEVFVVGGCVRDSLLGKKPKDYDLTTNLTPDEIKEIFSGPDYQIINNNGEKHGTVTVRYNEENYEITTYRVDGDYTDHRRPDSVSFTSKLEDDLARRDFTINALAANEKGEIIDYFNGIQDLENKIVRAVGNPRERFEEDGLRILRMVRFASELDFNIDLPTLMAAEDLKNYLVLVAKERKTAELNRIVCGKGFVNLIVNILVYNILSQVLPFDDSTYKHSINKLLTIFQDYHIQDRDYILSYAILFGKLSARRLLFDFLVLSNEDKDKISDICITVQEKLKCLTDEGTILNYGSYQDAVIYLIQKSLKDLKHNDNKDYCRYIILNSILLATVLGYVDMYKLPIFRNCLDEILAEGCYSLKQLAVKGNDLIELGLEPGPVIKNILQECLNEVIKGNLENKKEILLQYAKKKLLIDWKSS